LKGERAAVEIGKRVAIIGAGGADRVDLTHPDFHKTAVSDPKVSPDGSILVCQTFRGKILAWNLKTAELMAEITVIPQGVDYLNWTISDCKFLPKTNNLLFCRHYNQDDVLKDKDERNVDAKQRSG